MAEMLTRTRSSLPVALGIGFLLMTAGCQRSDQPSAQANPSPSVAKQTDERVSDLRQARFVAEGFLTALTKPNVEQSHGFCTPAHRKRVATITLPAGKVMWTIDKEAMAANGREASFSGYFDSSAGKQGLVVLVIKTMDAGQERWLVDACSIGG